MKKKGNLCAFLISVLIRVRGFPLRDILSLRALGDGLGQARKIVGTSAPSASFSQVLGLVRKITQNFGFDTHFEVSDNFLSKLCSYVFLGVLKLT